MDHFAGVEEYFDGDTTLLAAIGGRNLQEIQINHMGDFNSIIDFPPAPKLDILNNLIPSRATPEELRGEALFNGKAQCAVCHVPALQFTDNSMHDLKIERFYDGRPEGAIKTFPLRGIKDSPPYLHDGRLLTLEDTVEFFNMILRTQLTAQEKKDLVQYLRVLWAGQWKRHRLNTDCPVLMNPLVYEVFRRRINLDRSPGQIQVVLN